MRRGAVATAARVESEDSRHHDHDQAISDRRKRHALGRGADDSAGAARDGPPLSGSRCAGVSGAWVCARAIAEFAEQVDLAARGLVALGIEHGEHVAIWATNVPEWVVLQFATARIGAVLVNINPAYRPFELKYVLNQSDSVALFLVAQFKTSDYFAMLAEVCPELAASQPGQLRSHGLSQACAGSWRWKTMRPAGRHHLGRDARAGQPRCPPDKLDEVDRQLDPQPADQHSIHVRHHRLSQGGHAQPSQSAAQRLLHRHVPGPDGRRPRLHSGAVLSLLRLRAGHDHLGRLRRGDGHSGRKLQCRGHARRHRKGAGHGALRRAHDVHRPVAGSDARRPRS